MYVEIYIYFYLCYRNDGVKCQLKTTKTQPLTKSDCLLPNVLRDIKPMFFKMERELNYFVDQFSHNRPQL